MCKNIFFYFIFGDFLNFELKIFCGREIDFVEGKSLKLVSNTKENRTPKKNRKTLFLLQIRVLEIFEIWSFSKF
jgi:hypothetical protein